MKMSFTSLGRFLFGKTVPSVLSTGRGVLKKNLRSDFRITVGFINLCFEQPGVENKTFKNTEEQSMIDNHQIVRKFYYDVVNFPFVGHRC